MIGLNFFIFIKTSVLLCKSLEDQYIISQTANEVTKKIKLDAIT